MFICLIDVTYTTYNRRNLYNCLSDADIYIYVYIYICTSVRTRTGKTSLCRVIREREGVIRIVRVAREIESFKINNAEKNLISDQNF